MTEHEHDYRAAYETERTVSTELSAEIARLRDVVAAQDRRIASLECDVHELDSGREALAVDLERACDERDAARAETERLSALLRQRGPGDAVPPPGGLVRAEDLYAAREAKR